MTRKVTSFLLLRRTCLLLLLLPLLGSPHARAEEDKPQAGAQELANPFSDFVPFEDEYDIDEDERFMYFGRFFGIALGTGLHRFTGNIGKLYNTALPVMDFRMLYFFDFRLAGQLGLNSSSHAFNAVPLGAVEVSMLRLSYDMKYYFDTKNVGAAITAANPYAILGVAQNFRSQAYQTLGQVQKDTAFSVSGGLGMEFALKPRKTSIGFEGRLHKFFFKDRYEQTYLDSGIPDTTGDMVSFLTSVIFFF